MYEHTFKLRANTGSTAAYATKMITMTTPTAHYDGQAEWYDAFTANWADANWAPAADLLGAGSGPCLEIGCGTARYAPVIRSTGRTYVGVDFSRDQLRIARTREPNVVHGDTARLPFADNAFPTVTAFWVSTDVDDFSAVVREAARVLTPGGLFVFYGVHPCFNGPCIENRDDGALIIHPLYRQAGRHQSSPWWGDGIRGHVGMSHVPLAEFFTAFIDAGLRLTRVVEPRDDPIPHVLAVAAVLA